MYKQLFFREIKRYKSLMRDYIDQSNDVLNDSNIETDIGIMVTCATRILILELYYTIFKEISNNNPNIIDIINTKLKRLTKLNKLHFYQLKKLKQYNTEENTFFFLSVHKMVLTYLICAKKNKMVEKIDLKKK